MKKRKGTLRVSTNKYVEKSCGNAKGSISIKNERVVFELPGGKTLTTSRIKSETILGSLESPRCKEFSFETYSGQFYIFDL